MDRRKFLLKTGQITAALSAAKSPLLPLANAEPSPRESCTLENEWIAWDLSWPAGKLATVSYVNKIANAHSLIAHAEELVLTFSAADERIEIPWWKFRFSPDATAVSASDEQGVKQGFHRPEFSDVQWQVTENLLLKRLSGPSKNIRTRFGMTATAGSASGWSFRFQAAAKTYISCWADGINRIGTSIGFT
jgi:hypothetical protein